MRGIALLLIAVSASASHAAPVPKELKKDEKIQGTWKVESLVNHGKPSTENLYWTISAEGNLCRHESLADPRTGGNVILKQDRATMSLDYVAGQTTYFGIYRLRGDTLEFCLSDSGAERPATIEATPKNYLWTLKRIRE